MQSVHSTSRAPTQCYAGTNNILHFIWRPERDVLNYKCAPTRNASQMWAQCKFHENFTMIAAKVLAIGCTRVRTHFCEAEIGAVFKWRAKSIIIPVAGLANSIIYRVLRKSRFEISIAWHGPDSLFDLPHARSSPPNLFSQSCPRCSQQTEIYVEIFREIYQEEYYRSLIYSFSHL